MSIVRQAGRVTVVRYATTPEQPWRNGRGVTRELHAGDGWRLSVATIAEGGEFSFFPGWERTFVLGRGRLDLAVEETVHSMGPGMLVRFPGEAGVVAAPVVAAPVLAAPVTEALTDGAAIAVNVMTDRDRCTATVQVEHIDGPSPTATVLVLLSGAATIEGVALAPFDAWGPAPAGAADCTQALVAVITVEPV